MSSVLTSPPSANCCCSSADSSCLSLAAASPDWELCASSAMTAKVLPCAADSSRTAFNANGNVWMVHTTIFLSPDRASANSALLLPPSPLMVATTPVVSSKPKIASCNCPSMTLRSDTTSTESNTFLCEESQRKRVASGCAVVLCQHFPSLWLGGLHPGDSVLREQRKLTMIVGIIGRIQPALGSQCAADFVFKVDFSVETHWFSGGMSATKSGCFNGEFKLYRQCYSLDWAHRLLSYACRTARVSWFAINETQLHSCLAAETQLFCVSYLTSQETQSNLRLAAKTQTLPTALYAPPPD